MLFNGFVPASRQYICLLRGINVGGHGKLPMAQLRELCEELGCTDVSTYVQSGNVILRSSLRAAKLAPARGRDQGSGRVPAAGRGSDSCELVKALDANPYPDTEPKFMHIGFLSAKPTAKAVASLGDIDCSPEAYTLAGKEIYLNYVNGAGQSKKLARVPFEKKLGVSITARNLNTIAQLITLSTP